MKNNRNKANAKRAQRKHIKAVARKGKGAQYGSSVKQMQNMPSHRIEQVLVQGTDSREVLSDMFVDDPVGKLNDTVAKANSTAKEIKIS